jgi:hypothetical protein
MSRVSAAPVIPFKTQYPCVPVVCTAFLKEIRSIVFI